MSMPTLILLHALGGAAAIVCGGVVLARPKGTSTHRLLGRLWVACMAAVALSSFAIRSDGHFSWIHGLSLWVLISLTVALLAIRAGDVARHLRWMRSTYYSVVVAGVFTLLPQRSLGYLVWHSLGIT